MNPAMKTLLIVLSATCVALSAAPKKSAVKKPPAARVSALSRAAAREHIQNSFHASPAHFENAAALIAFFGWQPERVTTVHLGVSSSFRPRTAPEIAPALQRHGLVPGQYSLCVSTIEPRKRIGALLTAYGLLPMALLHAKPPV